MYCNFPAEGSTQGRTILSTASRNPEKVQLLIIAADAMYPYTVLSRSCFIFVSRKVYAN